VSKKQKQKTDGKACKDCKHRGRAAQHRAYCIVHNKYTRRKQTACSEFKERS